MKIKKIRAQRKMGIGLLIGLCLFVWVGNTVADDEENEVRDKIQKSRKIRDRDEERDDGGDSDSGTTTSANIIAIHDRRSPQYEKDCTDCHKSILSEQSLNPSFSTAHVIMLPQTPGENTDVKCRWCHQTVDLRQKSAGNLRRQVDVTLCALCHGSFGVETQFYQAGPSPDTPDGPSLYGLVCAACHGDLANSEVKNESASDIQEEIDDNEGGMGPLKFLSSGEIQAIAEALVNPDDND